MTVVLICRRPTHSLQRGAARRHRPGEGRGGSGRAEFEELDRVIVLHAAAHPLGGVEEHVGLGGIGIAQHAHAEAVDDQIAAAEIAEGNGEGVRADVRHVLGLGDREVIRLAGWPATAAGCQM